MKFKTKIIAGLAALGIASLPFLLKQKEQNEFIDVLCKDVWESEYPKSTPNSDGYMRKVYYVSGGKAFMAVAVPEELVKDQEKSPWKHYGAYFPDPTPQSFYGHKVVGCRLFEAHRRNLPPSQKDLEELEKEVRAGLHYKQVEQKIIEDILSTGTEKKKALEPLFNLPIIRDLFKVPSFLVVGKDYILDDGVKIYAEITISSTPKYSHLNYWLKIGNNVPVLCYEYGLTREVDEASFLLEQSRTNRSITRKRLDQLEKLIE